MKKVVFFIDDDPEACKNFLEAVARAGLDTIWDVHLSTEGYAISNLLLKWIPDVCVVDWDFGKSDSADPNEVIERAREANPSVAIIKFTQFVNPNEAAVENSGPQNSSEVTISKSDPTLHIPEVLSKLILEITRLLI